MCVAWRGVNIFLINRPAPRSVFFASSLAANRISRGLLLRRRQSGGARTHARTYARKQEGTMPAIQPTNQPTNQPVNQPASQPGIFTCIFMKSLFRMTIHRDEQRTMTASTEMQRWSVERRPETEVDKQQRQKGKKRAEGEGACWLQEIGERGGLYDRTSSLRTHVDARDTLVRCHGSFLRSFVRSFVRPSVRPFVRTYVHTLVGWLVGSFGSL